MLLTERMGESILRDDIVFLYVGIIKGKEKCLIR